MTGRGWRREPAVLEGHTRYLMLGRNYPGLTPAAHCETSGTLYHDLEATTLELLDRYEGEEYVRTQVTVRRADGAPLSAHAYVVAPGCAHLLTRIGWDRARFERESLSGFLLQLDGHC